MQKRPADEEETAGKRVCDDSRLTKYMRFEKKLRQRRIEKRIATLLARTVDELISIGGSDIKWFEECDNGRDTARAVHLSYEQEILEVWSLSGGFCVMDTMFPASLLMSASVPRSDLELSVREWIADSGCCDVAAPS